MLRGSINKTGESFEMDALNGGAAGGTIPHEADLIALTDAVIGREREACDRMRTKLEKAIGKQGVADSCAVIAAFQGFNRIADSAGTDVDPAQTPMLGSIREAIGLDGFYRTKTE